MNEQNISWKFCFKLGKTLKETYVILVRVQEDQALCMKCTYECFVCFREGQESVSDKTRCGRSETSISVENIEKMRKLIMKDRRSTVRVIAVPSMWG
ncbi:hypothetical protein TNCV_2885651 [Trichonephila clavipes]|nr:hypothetical protein TNCV_2885651 [Trichonephila clavipes]